MNTLLSGVIVIAIVFVVMYLVSSVKILAEYERGVIFRLGRVDPKPKGPGPVLVLIPFHRMVRISLRVEALEVLPQDLVTRDNVTVKVNAVIYFRVVDPTKAVVEVANFLYATTQLAQTTLRSVLGQVELDELLSQRDNINVRLQAVLDHHTGPWGIKVILVEVKQVDLPEQMIRAIARQAEAERERRAKVIHAEGEFMASKKLSMAAHQIQKEPVAIQLRYLQTLVEIGSDKNSTVIFPVPVDLLTALSRFVDKRKPIHLPNSKYRPWRKHGRDAFARAVSNSSARIASRLVQNAAAIHHRQLSPEERKARAARTSRARWDREKKRSENNQEQPEPYKRKGRGCVPPNSRGTR